MPTSPPFVRLVDVSLSLEGRSVLRGVTWSLTPGEVWAVTGPNGAGKSSFLRVVAGLTWPTSGERRYALDGTETRSPLPAREAVALVSPESSDWYLRQDWALTALDVVTAGATRSALPSFPRVAAHEALALDLLGRLGLADLAQRDVRTLSGGQRRRVMLARALAGGPRVMLLDEFFEGVDAGSRGRLRALVTDLVASGLTVVYTTHRPEDALEGTTHHLTVRDGRVTVGRPAPPHAARTSAEVVGGGSGEPLVTVSEARVYRGGVEVLTVDDWTWRSGEHWVVTGENGSGKSTLLGLLAGELHPAWGGRVRRAGLGERATLEQRRRTMSLVSPEFSAALLRAAAPRPRVTGADVVGSGVTGTVAAVPRDLTARERARLVDVTTRLGLEELLTRDVRELSYGQLRRLLLARAVVGEPRVLLLDEPFDSLDAAFRGSLLDLLTERAAGGTHVALAAHHASDVPSWMTHAAHLHAGRVVRSGPR